jgi:AraC-like DNA-binding protein
MTTSGTPPLKPILTSQDRKLVEALQASALYRAYQESFRLATGFSMFLRLAKTDQIPRVEEQTGQSAFCRAMSESAATAPLCNRAHADLQNRKPACSGSCGGVCFARIMETAIPLNCGGKTIAWLWTGQVFVAGEAKGTFREVAEVLTMAGCSALEVEKLRHAWESTLEVGADKYRGVVVLLETFARQLGELANRLVIAARPQEPTVVTTARRYIRENLTERLTLTEISRHSGMSPHHFCRVFRNATGVNLIDYINRSRVECAKQLLSKQYARVSEVAFEIGYQSLSQFNRSFRNVTGLSPTEFRRRLLKPSALKRAA